MGKCRICGLSAGLFANEHEACVTQQKVFLKEQQDKKSRSDRTKSHLVELASSLSRTAAGPEWFKERLEFLRSENPLSPAEVEECLIAGVHRAIDDYLEDHLLTNDEATRLFGVCDAFGLAVSSTLPESIQKRLVKTLILTDVENRKIVPRLSVSHDLPVVLQKDEQKVWLFVDSKMYSYVTRTRYEGASQGVSIRVARGLYFRLGQTQGERLQSEELQQIDSGFVLITNRNTYFKGGLKTLKVPHSKLISVLRWDDAVELVKESANPKPVIFSVDDPWFAHNLISKLAANLQ